MALGASLDGAGVEAEALAAPEAGAEAEIGAEVGAEVAAEEAAEEVAAAEVSEAGEAGSGAFKRASLTAFALAQSRRAVARCEHKVESFTVGVVSSSSASAVAVVSGPETFAAPVGAVDATADRDAEAVAKGVVT